MLTLIHIDDSPDRAIFHLKSGVLRIGRHLDSDIRLEDSSVSLLHATITAEQKNGKLVYVLRDYSLNGCYINGTKQIFCTLNEHDVVRFGAYVFLVQIKEVQAPAPKTNVAYPSSTSMFSVDRNLILMP